MHKLALVITLYFKEHIKSWRCSVHSKVQIRHAHMEYFLGIKQLVFLNNGLLPSSAYLLMNKIPLQDVNHILKYYPMTNMKNGLPILRYYDLRC